MRNVSKRPVTDWLNRMPTRKSKVQKLLEGGLCASCSIKTYRFRFSETSKLAAMLISALRRVVDNAVVSQRFSAASKPATATETSDKTKHKLRKFLSRRPTLQSVRDKGYIKGTPPKELDFNRLI